MSTEFQREYLVRLPLPLAQLYSRAFNAKDARSRHDNAFYLLETLIKLAAAPAISLYLADVRQGFPRVEKLDRLLLSLALPSLGQWTAMLRELTRHFGSRADAAVHPLGRLAGQLEEKRKDRPAVLDLYRRVKNGPDGALAGDQSCSLLELLDAMVQYRNGVFGHGGPRFESFYATDMGPLLFPAINEILDEGVLDYLGPPGSRLVYVISVERVEEDEYEIGLRELVGREGERMAPLRLSAGQAKGLVPNRVAVLWPGRPVPLRLDPLLIYRETETAEEVLFLNRDRDGRKVEYLSYNAGGLTLDRTFAPALVEMLSLIADRPIVEADLDRLAEQSIAETLSLEATRAPQPIVGQVRGDFEILGEIGRGGMGVVFLARQLSLGRLVALKMLPCDLQADKVALARFRREIRHLAECDHPNIVKVLASGSMTNGELFYAMEYIPGCDLEMAWRELSNSQGKDSATTVSQSTWSDAVRSAVKKRLEQTVRPGSTSPAASPDLLPQDASRISDFPPIEDDQESYVRHIVALIRDAALALQVVHDRHIIHRDVKPANLMLTPDGARIVLMDFGLAKGESVSMSASRTGGLLGTLRYAAPEQLAARMMKVGPRADVRGLGVALWELLTRRRLFADAEDERALAAAVMNCDVPALRTIDTTFDRDLEAIVARATERDSDRRIERAGLLAEYLQIYLDGKRLPIRIPGVAELSLRWIKRHRAVLSITAMAAVLVLAAGISVLWVEESRRRDYASSLVEQISTAEIGRIPDVIGRLREYRRYTDPLLQEAYVKAAAGSAEKLHTAIARLPIDPLMVVELRERLPTITPEQFPVVRAALMPHSKKLTEPLWSVALDEERGLPVRFQATCALATYAPEDVRWAEVRGLAAEHLVSLQASEYLAWREALREASGHLIEPLSAIFRDGSKREQARIYATETLADYAGDRLDILFDLLADAEPFQFQIIFDKLKEHEDAVAFGKIEIAKQPWENATEDEKEALAKRQSNAAVALAKLGANESVWPVLRHSPDPRVRSYVIHALGPLGVDPAVLIERFDREPDVTIRRSLLLAIGEFTQEQLPLTEREKLVAKLLAVFVNDPDAGLHAASEWLLRQWGEQERIATTVEKLKQTEGELQAAKSTEKRQWFVNTQGQTFVVIEAGDFLMGSPESEPERGNDELLHPRLIKRRFAMAAHETTKAAYERFIDAVKIHGAENEEWVKTSDSPEVGMTWFEAAWYCNWLSEMEGIDREQWCYEPNDKGEYGPGMKAKGNHLDLNGYRLPTEAEWEYACRSGTTTSRYYGLSESLLMRYSWYVENGENRTWPVGSLKPNDLGVFDILGNALEWCFDAYGAYRRPDNSLPNALRQVPGDSESGSIGSIAETDLRVLRGGSYHRRPVGVRSAARNSSEPNYRYDFFGFRVSRTYP